MFTVDGGTQALRRTMAYVIDIGDGDVYEISIPDELAALAACITDHADELDRLAGSDRKRIRHLADALSDPRDPARLGLDEPYRTAGQDTLPIFRLCGTMPVMFTEPAEGGFDSAQLTAIAGAFARSRERQVMRWIPGALDVQPPHKILDIQAVIAEDSLGPHLGDPQEREQTCPSAPQSHPAFRI